MSIVDLIFPKICVGCGREGQYICSKCQRKLTIPSQICPMCCKPSLDGWTHPKCRTKYDMERLVAGLPYRGMVQDCLKKVKYKSAWEIIGFLYKLCDFEGIDGDLITSVPMWRQKERERGFNQAEIIAELLAKDLPGDSRKAEIIERVRPTRPMFGLKKEERNENIEGAFEMIDQQTDKLTNRRVILVDDVWTTGATMRECARVLKLAGAKEVWGLTIAR